MLVQKQLDFGPRTVNSEAAEKCAEFIADYAKQLGYEVTIDEWTEGGGNFKRTFRNVICERKGQGSQFVVLGSHYDTKILPNFVGANDGGSSTALLMQVMKDIAKSDKWNHHCGMRFVFFDGEEAVHVYSKGDGLNGSNRYAFGLVEKGEHTKCKFKGIHICIDRLSITRFSYFVLLHHLLFFFFSKFIEEEKNINKF